MTNSDIAYKTQIALLKFVERVSEGKDATAEEVETLPAVASVLLESMGYVD